MGKMIETIDSLEHKVVQLVQKMDELEHSKARISGELTKAIDVIQQQTDAIKALERECDILRTTNSLLGSDENKRDTKLKINVLIREIDYCIAQLSD
jgi:uncharacterized membrane protein YccC